jgi:hypothetical protein
VSAGPFNLVRKVCPGCKREVCWHPDYRFCDRCDPDGATHKDGQECPHCDGTGRLPPTKPSTKEPAP